MAELAVVRRYARALFDAARHSGSVAEVEVDLRSLDLVLRDMPRLRRALRAPTIPAARKQEVLEHGFQGRVSALTLRFIGLVVRKRREDVLFDIYGEYLRLSNALRNILPVDVTAAVEMSPAERVALSDSLGKRTGKTVELNVRVDPEIMGGIVVRMGDVVLDGSVKSKLSRLRTRLQTGRLN